MTSNAQIGPYQNGVEIGSCFNELFCLKRKFAFSNLTPVDYIQTIRHTNNKIESKVAQINLFHPDGEITILDLWNEDALNGVQYLWDLLGTEDAVLLKISKLTDRNVRRVPTYKTVPATSYMIENSPFPIKARIVAQTPFHGQSCDLKKQCKRIMMPNSAQLLCHGLPVRHFSQW